MASMLNGLRSHSMGRRARAKRVGRWLRARDFTGPLQYADLDVQEAVLCGAEVLAFHPRTSEPLALIWPDGQINFNSTYFSHGDARELATEIRELLARPE